MLHDESRKKLLLPSSSASSNKLLPSSSTYNSPGRNLKPSVLNIEDHSSKFKTVVLEKLVSRDSKSIETGVLKQASQFHLQAVSQVPQNAMTVNGRPSTSKSSVYIQPSMTMKTLSNHTFSPKEIKNAFMHPLSFVGVCKIRKHTLSNNPDSSKIQYTIVPGTVKNSQNSKVIRLSKQVNTLATPVLSTQTVGSKSLSTALPDIKKPVVLMQDQKETKSLMECREYISDIDSKVLKRPGPVQKPAQPAVNTDLKSSSEPKHNSTSLFNKNLRATKPFTNPSVLHTVLMPCIERLFVEEVSAPFQQPVDVEKLKIPDYYKIIKHPMDLSTIKNKLKAGQYEDGWQFVDDVWLMFNNAWLYNKKTSDVYKCCTKLSEIFAKIIEIPMKSLGYCCGQNYVFEPRILCCQSKDNCVIAKYANYWSFKDKYIFCKKCVALTKGSISLRLNTGESLVIYMNQLTEKINSVTKKEEFVTCVYCTIKHHKICSLYLEDIWKKGYICEYCKEEVGKRRILPDELTYKSLQKTKLGSHLEMRVNKFLQSVNCKTRVAIRVVYQGQKEFVVTPGLKSRYVDTGIWPEKFPYTAKTILAFQVKPFFCFFALFVQEYGSDCPEPNRRRVYISYLDSVHYFTPKDHKTSVYQEIILGYLDYVKCLGFKAAHLWSCPPPNENDDYIFYCHPKEQKVPTPKRLQEWYQKVLNKAVSEGIVREYKDTYEQAVQDNIRNAFELPYFEGDFLPSQLEKEVTENSSGERSGSSKKNVFEDNEKKVEEGHAESFTMCKKGKKPSKKAKISIDQYTQDALTEKMYFLMKEHRKSFLVIHLCTPDKALSCAIEDPDPAIHSTIMDTRDSFLNLAKDQYWEFSSLRRAQYSSLALSYYMIKDNMESYSCNHCNAEFLKGFHCHTCDDFDLCCDCYERTGHGHAMEKINLDYQVYGASCRRNVKRYPIEFWLYILHHVSKCLSTNCSMGLCKRLRILQYHASICEVQYPHCRICLTYASLVYKHFIICEIGNCQLLMCRKLKAIKRKMQTLQKSSKDEEWSIILQTCIANSECDVPERISELTRVFLSSISERTSKNVPSCATQRVSPSNSSLQTNLKNKNSSRIVSSEINKYSSLVQIIHNNNSENNDSKIRNECAITSVKLEETKCKPHNFGSLPSSVVNSMESMIKIKSDHKKSINYSNGAFVSATQPAVSNAVTVPSLVIKKGTLHSNKANFKMQSFNSPQNKEISIKNMNNTQKLQSSNINPVIKVEIHSNEFSASPTQMDRESYDNADDIHDTYIKSEVKLSNVQIPAAQNHAIPYAQLNTNTHNAHFHSDNSINNQPVKLPAFQQHSQQSILSDAWNSNSSILNSNIKNEYSSLVNSQWQNNESLQFSKYSPSTVYSDPQQLLSQNSISLNTSPEKSTMHNQFGDMSSSNASPLNMPFVKGNKKVTATNSSWDFLSDAGVSSTVVHNSYSTLSNSSGNFQNLSTSEVNQCEMQIDSDNFSTNYFQSPNSETLEFSSVNSDNQMSFAQTCNINAVKVENYPDNENYCDISSDQNFSHSYETPMDCRNDASTSEESCAIQYNVLNSQGTIKKEIVPHQSNMEQPELLDKWNNSVKSVFTVSTQSFLQQQHHSMLSGTVSNESFQKSFVSEQTTSEPRKPVICNLKNGESVELQNSHGNQYILPSQQDFSITPAQLTELNSSVHQWNSVSQLPSTAENNSSHFTQSATLIQMADCTDVQQFIEL